MHIRLQSRPGVFLSRSKFPWYHPTTEQFDWIDWSGGGWWRRNGVRRSCGRRRCCTTYGAAVIVFNRPLLGGGTGAGDRSSSTPTPAAPESVCGSSSLGRRRLLCVRTRGGVAARTVGRLGLCGGGGGGSNSSSSSNSALLFQQHDVDQPVVANFFGRPRLHRLLLWCGTGQGAGVVFSIVVAVMRVGDKVRQISPGTSLSHHHRFRRPFQQSHASFEVVSDVGRSQGVTNGRFSSLPGFGQIPQARFPMFGMCAPQNFVQVVRQGQHNLQCFFLSPPKVVGRGRDVIIAGGRSGHPFVLVAMLLLLFHDEGSERRFFSMLCFAGQRCGLGNDSWTSRREQYK